MSNTPRTVPISSFASSYVPLDLVPYLKSGQVMPFHIFNHIVLPDFLHHLSNERSSLQISSSCAAEDNSDVTTCRDQEDSDPNPLAQLLEEIDENVVHIYKASRILEPWETEVNKAISRLVLQSLDDANDSKDNPVNADILRRKYLRTHKSVEELREKIYSPLDLSSHNIDSESFKRSKFSLTRDLPMENSVAQSTDANSGRETEEQSVNRIKAFYNGLNPMEQKCLLCFSVFPENAVIKKKVLVHWWIGEEFVDCSSICSKDKDKTAEKIANEYFKKFIEGGVIEEVYKKQRPKAESCQMYPSVRSAVIGIAKKEKFAEFDETEMIPTANIVASERPCLVKTEKGPSIRDFTYGFQSKQEHVQALFNVSERRLEFKLNWFSKMKNVKVLQLGKWQSSDGHLIEVEDGEFLKGLKKMEHLRYLSLRGVSRITELPNSICKLSNLRILNLNGCHDLEKLPDGIGALKKLTHLDMYECYLISHMPKGIALLSNLQILKGFVVAEAKSGSKCCRLEDLTKLKKLKKLSIHVDRKISDKGERELSSLAQFENLESLSISWSRIYKSGEERNLRRMSAMKWPSMERSPEKTPSDVSDLPLLPAGLKKLDLHYFPGSKISECFSLVQVRDLRKLYVRGGKLSDLQSDNCFWKGVEFLRLKFLNGLQMSWGEMQQVFPKLSYLEKCECLNSVASPVMRVESGKDFSTT